ncbi:cytochrome b N-terminal domain-containing protein [Kiritimatiellaeota bacterium B1221]|nr:cytochrome b N-terminal domain-containing protein [Kiritimatiellaeota bacterium B1221]
MPSPWKKFVHSVFPLGWPRSHRERLQAVRGNLWLHVFPARVRTGSLHPKATLGLGLITFNLFVILCLSGVWLMMVYTPSTALAYRDMNDLAHVVSGGRFLRNVHRWAAHLMVLFCILHLIRVFCTGAYKRPREFNWVLGVLLFGLTLALSFTGYLLPWDQLSFWAITVSANILDYVPVLGPPMRRLLLGGEEVGQAALLRFYVLHVFALPTVAFLLIAVHVWRVRKDGGLACSDPELRGKEDPNANTYVLTWPHLLLRLMLVMQATLILVFICALLWDAPLLKIANPAHPPNPSKAPWYFLGLQEMVSYSAFWGGFFIPTVFAVLLLLLPYVDSNPKGAGYWFSRHRRFAITLFAIIIFSLALLTVIGLWFRGTHWTWQWPWGGTRI